MLLFGAALFAATLVPASLRPEADRRVERLASLACPLVVATALLRVPLTAAGMGEGWSDAVDPATLRAALFDTAFGRAWMLHGAAVVLLMLCVVLRLRHRISLMAGIAGFAVASLAIVGHPAMHDGIVGWRDRATLALHLVAGAAWIGSLPEVLALMHRLTDPGPKFERHSRDAALALRRFSCAGHGAVALVIATGIAATLEIAASPLDLPFSAYGWVLAGKAALAVGMAGLALINRYELVPRLVRDPAGAKLALLRNSRAVLTLGLGAVTLAGLLGLLEPP